jgi:hypothetical protein
LRAKIILPIILITSLLTACGIGAPNDTATPLATSSSIPRPPSSPTPVAPLAILILPANMGQAASNSYQKTVYDLTQKSGMHFQVRNSLTPKDLPPGLKVVIALSPDPGIAALAAAAPHVQFLAVDIPGVAARGNVSVLAGSTSEDIPAFLAGYTAAMITNDYHIGMLLPKDNQDALKAYAAFKNGMIFYCGLCKPFYFPNFCLTNNLAYCYPQAVDIPASEDPARYGGYANVLINNYSVNTIYVYPDLAIKSLMDYLATTGAELIGTATPNPRPAGWAMTIQANELQAIQNAWPDLVAGKGGESVVSPLGISDLDSSTVTPGKQRLVQLTLDELSAGQISTGAGH